MKAGDMQVWWIPQVPMKPFTVTVSDVYEGVKIMRVLADYDNFQLRNGIKPDYCNAGGISVWTRDCDGEGTPGWEDWNSNEGDDDPIEWVEENPR